MHVMCCPLFFAFLSLHFTNSFHFDLPSISLRITNMVIMVPRKRYPDDICIESTSRIQAVPRSRAGLTTGILGLVLVLGCLSALNHKTIWLLIPNLFTSCSQHLLLFRCNQHIVEGISNPKNRLISITQPSSKLVHRVRKKNNSIYIREQFFTLKIKIHTRQDPWEKKSHLTS